MKKIIYSIIIFIIVFFSQVFAQDSMYVHLKTGVAKFLIADIDSVKFKTTTTIQYNYFISKVTNSTITHYSSTLPSINAPSDHSIIYDGSTSINLNDLVWATATNGVVEKKFEDFGFGTVGINYQFVFSSSFIYSGMGDGGNQNSYIQIQSDGRVTIIGGTSAIDRTPVVKVELKSMSGVILALAYIKFKIVSNVTPIPVAYSVSGGTYSYKSLFKDVVPGVSAGDTTNISLSWESMNQIYSLLGVSQNEFWNIYGSIPTVVAKVNDVVIPDATLTQYPLIRSFTPDVDDYAMKYQITPMSKFGATAITYTFTPTNTSYPVLNITFNYSIVKPAIKILEAFQNPDANSILSYGMMTNNQYLMQVYLGEAFGYDSGEYARSFGSASANKIDGATHTFALSTSTSNQGLATILPQAGGDINATLGTSSLVNSGQLLKLTSSMSASTLTFNLEFITDYPNGEKYIFPFNVTFKNPITIESASGADITFTDFITGQCDEKQVALSKNAKVKFMGQDLIVNGVPTSMAANYGITASNYTYGVAQNSIWGNSISILNPNAAMSNVKWCNAGTPLNTKALVGTIDASFNSSFAKLSNPIHKVYAQPEN